MQTRGLTTGFRMVLGGNVFGWTADEAASRQVLDAYVDAGGDWVDTADAYTAWVPGHVGGESEAVIGRWLAGRGSSARPRVATKVSRHPEFPGLSPDNVRAAVRASLQRLGVDVIDLYYAHFDDPETPIEETAAVFSELVDQGLVRAVGLSNYTADRVDEWFAAAAAEHLHAPVALQPQYNLVERGYEQALAPAARRHDLAVFCYYGLASGFLTGAYRPDRPLPDGPRAQRAAHYLDARGLRVLAALDEVAAGHGVPVAAVALAWLAAQPTVTAPIASARTLDQLETLLTSVQLELSDEEVAALSAASV